MASTYSAYYQKALESGQRYQDFVAARLFREGIIVVGFQSRHYQYTHGENLLGLEIKCDDQLAKTGNFWIEIAEKSNPANLDWVASGIDRGDSWLYGTGNYDEFWIFATRTLQEFRVSKKPTIRENGTKTSRGFLLSRCDASPLSARQFDWHSEPPLVLVRHHGREPGQEG